MEEVNYFDIGQKMKQLRNEQGVTQEEVANDLGCTLAYISNVENNRAKLNLRVLLYYSRMCKVPVDTILNAGRKDLPPDAADTELYEEMKNAFQSFSREEQKKIIKTLRLWKSE